MSPPSRISMPCSWRIYWSEAFTGTWKSASPVRDTKPPVPSEMYRQIKDFFANLPYKTGFNAIELAAWTHAEFVRIHPFVDGNGRTSRMIMNYQLMAQGFLPVSIAKENRLEYFDALEAYAVNGDLQPFTDMIAELEEQRLGEYLSITQETIQNNGPAMTL